MVVGEERKNPGLLKQVGYAKNCHYEEIKFVHILENECGHFKRKPYAKKVMKTLNKVKVKGRLGVNPGNIFKAKKTVGDEISVTAH